MDAWCWRQCCHLYGIRRLIRLLLTYSWVGSLSISVLLHPSWCRRPRLCQNKGLNLSNHCKGTKHDSVVYTLPGKFLPIIISALQTGLTTMNHCYIADDGDELISDTEDVPVCSVAAILASLSWTPWTCTLQTPPESWFGSNKKIAMAERKEKTKKRKAAEGQL